MTAFVTGVVFGAIGSAHCAGMCGPLVLTITRGLGRPSPRAQVQHALPYHTGRVLTYVLLGLAAGIIGQTLSLWGLGRALAVMAGLVLLLAAAGTAGPAWLRQLGARPAALATRACVTVNRWNRVHPVAGPFLAGAANGLLPCGLVYSALLTAAALGSASGAVVLMAGFGLGTVPALVALSMAATSQALGIRSRLRRLTPVLLALTAALLLARGLAPATGASHHGPAVVAPVNP
jgi:sulfite exporter TauE/SafE